MSRRRVAGVDIGSNTVRLLVADVDVDGDQATIVERIAEESRVTRLSEHVDKRGILLPAPIARTRHVLAEYRRIARDSGACLVFATATSAVRDADNGEAFLGEIEYGYGFRTRLLAGDAEAAMSWEGLRSAPALAQEVSSGSWVFLDIGGGSTEFVLARAGEVVDSHSFQLGCVRLTERHLQHDPPSTAEIAATRAAIAAELAERFPNPEQVPTLVGVAGTVTTMVARALELPEYDPEAVHGSRISRTAVEAELQLAASLPLAERRELPAMSPHRAPVILAGYCILAEALDHFGASEVLGSERDILDGITAEAGRIADREDLTELPEPHGRTVC